MASSRKTYSSFPLSPPVSAVNARVVAPPARPPMAGAQHGRRGGAAASPSDDFDAPAGGAAADLSEVHTSSSRRLVRLPRDHFDFSSGASSSIQSLSSSAGALDDKLDLSPSEAAARRGMLQESFFPSYRDDAAAADLASPEEMQKKDPLATQIWRLYSRNKSQLPNAERLENLTWRMMSMKMGKQRLEREGCVRPHIYIA